MKKLVIFIIISVICIALCGQIFAQNNVENAENNEQQNSAYNARAVLLCEAGTGQVLYAENPTEQLRIASVTKIMTLLIAAEEMDAGRLDFEDTIVASAHANSMDGSVIWLNSGEEMSAFDIIRSVVISSANDACVALAEHIAGSEEEFVKRMNARAEQLGMPDTHFSNCTGLDAENHFSSAADVAKMASELRKYDYFDELLLTRLTYVRENTDRATQLLNTNKLLGKYEGLTGLKTGTTDDAGFCFVGSARRGGMELVAVVLGCSDENERFDIAAELLDYGFEGFELFSPEFDAEKLLPLAVHGGVEREIALVADNSLCCLIPRGKSSEISYLYDLPDKIDAPLEKGSHIGKIIILLGDDTLFLAEITAANDVELLDFGKSFELIFSSLVTF